MALSTDLTDETQVRRKVLTGPFDVQKWFAIMIRTSDGRFKKGYAYTLKHGHSSGGKETQEYYAWQNMKTRCQNPNGKDFKNYGGRGITVCERWQSFENFFADMGPKPSPAHSLDRKNNELGYFKENCRWATIQEQNSNKRSLHFIEFQGRRMIVKDWAKFLGVPQGSLRNRLHRGWSYERTLTEPLFFRG